MKVEEHARSVCPADLPEGYLHVVVFGPGHGEAILVRTPDGRVGVVDACGKRQEASKRGSPIFALLRDLEVKRLLFACLTHPHADHFRGFAEVIQEYPPEHLWWSGTQERKFFKHYLEYLKKRDGGAEVSASDASHASELQAVVNAIGKLADQPSDISPYPRGQHLSDWKKVLDHRMINRANALCVESVLPSSAAVRIAEQDALGAANNVAAAERKLDPNRISAALLLSWGVTRVLLGGDALRGDAEAFAGWDGLQFSLGKIHLVKVPHHASDGAHSADRWREMDPDLAIVTCVRRANAGQPPRPVMLQTLLGTGTRVAVTSKPAWWPTEAHPLVADAALWAPTPVVRAKGSGNPALPEKIVPASAANEHANAVVVRLDDKGQIVVVQLHGEAGLLRVALPTTSPAI